VALRGNSAELHQLLGAALRGAGELDEAVSRLTQAVNLQPAVAEAWNNLGNALFDRGDWAPAIDAYARAVSLRSDFRLGYSNLADAIRVPQHAKKMLPLLERSATMHPQIPEIHLALATARQLCGQIDPAITAARRAVALDEHSATAHAHLARILREAGQFDEAISESQRAIAIKPDWHVPRFELGMLLLQTGRIQQGWIEYEWRDQSLEIQKLARQFHAPRWAGADISGRRILVWAEQGFGDAIQFARYLPMLAARGAEITLYAPGELCGLLRRVEGVHQFVARGQTIPQVDLHCPMLSLPRLLGTNSLENIPTKVPYLVADPQLCDQWTQRLRQLGSGQTIGLVWTGRPYPPGRSIPLTSLKPLAQLGSATWVSLQFGDPVPADSRALCGFHIHDFSAQLGGFDDMAALIASLDRVITIDTAVAHLAGALGKPVWTMLRSVADWRWFLHRSDSPWYPTMRLFRQHTEGDWSTMIEDLAKTLATSL
jgi:Flp pilus assembly protein TadD